MKRFLGGLLMTVGAVIGGLSGACTLTFLVMSLDPHGGGQILPLIFLLGIPPVLIGVGLFYWGRRLWRSSAPPPPDPKVF